MMRPVIFFVGLRYLRSQRSNHFASFVTVASVIGVALGVAALIVVLSVMNGFGNELRDRLLSMEGHASVTWAGPSADWPDWVDDLRAWPGIEAAAPYIELEAVLASGRELSGAVLSGIVPELQADISQVDGHMRAGSLNDLRRGERLLVLGRALARRLGVNQGDRLTVMVPRKDKDKGLTTGLREFTVSGIFELGLRDHDGVRGLIHLQDAAGLAGLGSNISGIRVKAADVFAAPQLIREWAADWEARTGLHPEVRDWVQDNSTYFRAVRIEKIMMTLLLSLIVAVAAFNIVATLVMVVTDKRAGIAILRTMGFSRRSVVGIFALQGLLVGWIGVIFGVCLGVMMALNVETLAPGIEAIFGFEFMPADVYYLTSLPADLRTSDVVWVSVIALLLTGLATLYPAFRAASVAPAEVLRYE